MAINSLWQMLRGMHITFEFQYILVPQNNLTNQKIKCVLIVLASASNDAFATTSRIDHLSCSVL